MPDAPSPKPTIADQVRQADINEQLRLEEKRAAKMREVAKLRWYIANGQHKTELGEYLDFKRWPFLVEIYQNDAHDLVLFGSVGWGKFQPLSAKVRTPSGWKTMGEIKARSRVRTPDGKEAKVTAVFPQGMVPIFKITLADGSATEAGAEHLWMAFDGDACRKLRTDELTTEMSLPIAFCNHRPRITSIEPVGKKEAQCILIDHPDHLYITDDYIITHNTEYAICDDAAKAAADLRVFHVMDNFVKRDRFVLGRIDPCFAACAFYEGMLRAARNKNREMDSARFKHFGDGSINFVGSNSDSDFATYRADAATVDEHQLCELSNLNKIFHRMTGSDYGFVTSMGNPKHAGTKDNQNIHWEFLQTDQRQWHVPCPSCGVYQLLDWWKHFIREEKNEHGAILSTKPRDENWDPDGPLEFRPICPLCQQPMYRLSQEGKWIASAPGRRRRGYQLSALYNPTSMFTGTGPKSMLTYYRKGMHNPNELANFINNQLGLPYNTTGSSITHDMLETASTGVAAGVPAYRFIHASEMQWRESA